MYRSVSLGSRKKVNVAAKDQKMQRSQTGAQFGTMTKRRNEGNLRGSKQQGSEGN